MEALALFALIAFFLPIILLIVATSRIKGLERRIDEHEKSLREMRNRVEAIAKAPREADARREDVLPVTIESPTAFPATPAEPIDPGIPATAPLTSGPTLASAETPPGAPTVKAPPAPRVVKPSRTKEEWEALVGGRLLNLIGALALIIGIGFFLKYAFDNQWITETMRVIMGGAAGITLLLLGALSMRKGYQIFAQGLTGAGIATLYLSIYASFNFYHLVPQIPAFVLMSLVTIIAFYHAMRYDSLATALLGLAGGFLTPFLLSTGSANEVGLFTYIALLDAGLLAIVARRPKWSVLEPLALLGTVVIYAGWFIEHYKSPDTAITALFVTLFWGMFFAADLYRSLRSTEEQSGMAHLVAVFNALWFWIAAVTLAGPHGDRWIAVASLGIGLVYLAAGIIADRRGATSFTHARLALTGVVAIVAATGFEFRGYTLAIVWSLEALALTGYGVRRRHSHLWGAAFLLFAMAAIQIADARDKVSSALATLEDSVPHGWLAVLILTATLAAGAVLHRRGNNKVPEAMLHYGWGLSLLALVTLVVFDSHTVYQLSEYPPGAPGADFCLALLIACGWALYAVVMVAIGRRLVLRPAIHCGLGALLLAAVVAGTFGIGYEPIREFTPIVNIRAATLALVIGAVVAMARLLRGMEKVKWKEFARGALRLGAALLLLDLLTVEAWDYFERAQALLRPEESEALFALRNQQQLSFSGIWLVYSGAMMALGIWRRSRALRVTAFALFAFTILKIFLYDLSFLGTLYRIFSFIGLGLILLLVSYLYGKYREIIFGTGGVETTTTAKIDESEEDQKPPSGPIE